MEIYISYVVMHWVLQFILALYLRYNKAPWYLCFLLHTWGVAVYLFVLELLKI